MGYGASKSGSYDGFSISTLEPGIYTDVELEEVKYEKATKQDGTEGKQILTFIFGLPDGRKHQHTEWETDEEDKQNNMVKRIEHIAHKFIPVSVIEANTATDFQSLANFYVNQLNGKTKGIKDLEIKVVANVYQGKVNSPSFPRYVGFIARKSQEKYKPLSLTPKEMEDIRKAKEASNARPDTEADVTTGNTGASSVAADF